MRRIVVAAVVGLGALLLAAGAAAAQGFPDDYPANATGRCTASADLSNGVRVDPYESGGVYELPISGSATYEGTTPYSGPERRIEGFVKIKTPPGIPDISFDDRWVWDDDATDSSDRGTVTWDFPSAIPRNVEMTVVGQHVDADGIRCNGTIKIRFEGGFFDTFVGWVAVGGTAVSATGVAFSAVSKATGPQGKIKPGGAATTIVADPPAAAPPPVDPKATVVDPDAPTIVNPPPTDSPGGES
ncbi:MAG: hypothetical protein RIE08_05115 [Acidimicrobiales bacterium]